MQRMEAAELAEYLISSKPMLLDVREPWEFDICHIDSSINIPIGQVPQNIERIREVEGCVVICHHGIRSRQIIHYLQQQACENLINLEGGVDAWARQVDYEMPLY